MAAYLKELMRNPVEYLSYFWWTDHFRHMRRTKEWCRLCEALHSDTHLPKKQVIEDIQAWTNREAHCDFPPFAWSLNKDWKHKKGACNMQGSNL